MKTIAKALAAAILLSSACLADVGKPGPKPELKMPRLAGLHWKAAEKALRGLGLRVGWAHVATSDPKLHGTVSSQWPAPGTPLPAGFRTWIYLYRHHPACPAPVEWTMTGGRGTLSPDGRSLSRRGPNRSREVRFNESRVVVRDRYSTCWSTLWDWLFDFRIGGRVPRKLRPGERFTLIISAAAGGPKMNDSVDAGVGVRAQGFDVYCDPAPRPGESAEAAREVRVGRWWSPRSCLPRKPVTHATKTYTFVVRTDAKVLSLSVYLRGAGTIVLYTWGPQGA